jgi:ribosome-binding protein aMBF1 (putative translation factor)
MKLNKRLSTVKRERYFVTIITSHGGVVNSIVHKPRQQLALGRAVRIARAVRALSQEELGFRAGLHRNYVGAIERGEINPTLRVLLKLARGLGIPLSELLADAESRASLESL